MQALVLERKHQLALREIDLDEPLAADDVRIAIDTVGICGSDVHYYQHGRIGPFVVDAPMVLGHEAAGVVVEVGSAVRHLQAGDRVTMEPGIPDPASRASRLGIYNLDPAVRFWATPPVHGVLRPSVVHPAAFTFRIPDNVGFGEAAMVEPLAVGMHAANKARIQPGDVAVVIGAGPIGMVTALAALAGGCSRIVIADPVQPKLELAASLGPVTTVDPAQEDLAEVTAADIRKAREAERRRALEDGEIGPYEEANLSPKRPAADVVPAVHSVRAGVDGSVWVYRYRSNGAVAGARQMVLAPDGRFVCHLPATKASYTIWEAGADYVLGVHTTELGVQHVAMYDLERPAPPPE